MKFADASVYYIVLVVIERKSILFIRFTVRNLREMSEMVSTNLVNLSIVIERFPFHLTLRY